MSDSDVYIDVQDLVVQYGDRRVIDGVGL